MRRRTLRDQLQRHGHARHRLNGPLNQPEVSLMWEWERTRSNPGTGDGIDTSIFGFERAVKRYRPVLSVD